MYSPRAMGRSNTLGTLSLTPLTVTKASRRADADRLARGERHRDPVDVADDAAEQVDVVEGQPAHRRRRAELELARHDDDDVRPEPLDLLLDLLLRPAAERDEDHDRRDADDDAEHGQRAAQPVGAQGVQGDPERLAGPHGAPTARRCSTRPSRIAIRRPASAATSRSWVTTTTATPRSALRPPEDAHHVLAAAGVEVAGRLVGEQQRRLADQRAGDGDPLLLATGELARPVPEPVAQPDRVQRGGRPLAALLLAHAAVDQRKPDVVQGARARQELEGLEDEPDGASCAARRARCRPSSTGRARPRAGPRRSAGRGSPAGASASTCRTRTDRRRRRTRPCRCAGSPRAAPRRRCRRASSCDGRRRPRPPAPCSRQPAARRAPGRRRGRRAARPSGAPPAPRRARRPGRRAAPAGCGRPR